MKIEARSRKTIVCLLIIMIITSMMTFPKYGYGDDEGKNLIAIKTINGKYLCAEDGGGDVVNATRDKIGDWETFQVVDLGRGKFALKSNNGDYIRVSKDGNSVYADSNEIGRRETFQLVILKNNKVAFKIHDGKYICAEDGGGKEVVANRDKIGDWETFEFIKVEKARADKVLLTAKSDTNGITITWTKPGNMKNIIGYNLYRGTASGKQDTTPITDFPIEGNSYTDKNVNRGTTYYYILRVVYKDNSLGLLSNELAAKLISKINLKARSAEKGVYLSWDKPHDSRNIIGYYLYRSKASGKQSTTPITDFPVEGTSYYDKNVERNTNYYYILKPVYRDSTLGDPSNEVSLKSGDNIRKIVIEVGSKYMYINGNREEIDPGRGTAVVINNGRTFLPIRAVVEAMGGEVRWRESDKRVSIYLNEDDIQLWIGDKIAKVNGKNKETDVAPYISDRDRTMLPLRFIAESLDLEVNWDGPSKTVTITMEK